jgi:hypothetical protein
MNILLLIHSSEEECVECFQPWPFNIRFAHLRKSAWGVVSPGHPISDLLTWGRVRSAMNIQLSIFSPEEECVECGQPWTFNFQFAHLSQSVWNEVSPGHSISDSLTWGRLCGVWWALAIPYIRFAHLKKSVWCAVSHEHSTFNSLTWGIVCGVRWALATPYPICSPEEECVVCGQPWTFNFRFANLRKSVWSAVRPGHSSIRFSPDVIFPSTKIGGMSAHRGKYSAARASK